MYNQKLSDIEIEILYKSVIDMDDFQNRIFSKINFTESNQYSIRFMNENVEIEFSKTLTKQIKFDYFVRVLVELNQQKKSDIISGRLNEVKKINNSLQNEIFKMGEFTYKIHKEFVEHIYFSRDIATGYPNYIKKIEQLKGIFKNPKNRLFIDETLIINILEFNKYLKEYGFENIEES